MRHTAVYSAAGVLGRMISFFLLPLYAVILRDVGYGVIGMLDVGLTLVAALVGWNFQVGLIRLHAEVDVERRHRVVPTGTVVMGAAVAAMVALVVVAQRPLAQLLLGDGSYALVVALAALSAFFDLVGRTALITLEIDRRSATYSLLSLIKLFLGIGTSLLFVVVLEMGITGYFVAGLVTSITSAVMALGVMVRLEGFGFDREIARDLLAFQLPLIPGTMASFGAGQIERVLVRFKLGLDTLGILEMGMKFPVLINLLFVEPFMRSWAPEQMKVADHEDGPQRLGDVFLAFLHLLLLFYLLISMNLDAVLRILTPSEFWLAVWPARIMALHVVIKAVPRHLGFGLVHAKKTGQISRVMAVVSAGKIGLSWVMISTFGLFGAAWSTLAATSVNAIWTSVLAWRFYPLRIDMPRLVVIVGAAIATHALSFLLPRETIVAFVPPIDHAVASMVDFVATTPLGTWREGRVIEALHDRVPEVVEVLVRTAMLLPYAVLGPLVHPPIRRRVRAMMSRGRARAV